jgi:hypothetical protein
LNISSLHQLRKCLIDHVPHTVTSHAKFDSKEPNQSNFPKMIRPAGSPGGD